MKVGSFTIYLTIAIGLRMFAAESASVDLATARTKLEKLASIFPSLYWHASDAWMRKNGKVWTEQVQKHDEFVSENRVLIESFEEVAANGERSVKSRIRLSDPEDPHQSWVFELVYKKGAWQTQSGETYLGREKWGDLFKMPGVRESMKPYFDRGLKAFADGADISAAIRTQ